MDNLNVSDIQKNKGSTIAGYVLIKRKMFWAERYARVKNGKLLYYQEKTDSVPRATIPLADCTIIQKVNGREELFELKPKTGQVASLFLKIENKTLRPKFIQCLQQNTKLYLDNSPLEQQPECISYEEDPTAKYAELPNQYKYILEEKYSILSTQQKYVKYEKYQRGKRFRLRNNNQQHREGGIFNINSIVTLGFAVALGYSMGIGDKTLTSLILILALAKGLLSLFLGSFVWREMAVKEEILIKENITDVLYTLKEKRQQLYLDQHTQIEYAQSIYKSEEKLYIVGADKDKLVFFWEIAGFSNETLVTVYYKSKAPSINLFLLESMIVKMRIAEALKGITPQAKQFNKLLNKENMSGSVSVVRRETSSVVNKQSTIGSQTSTGKLQQSQNQQTAYLPPFEELKIQNSVIPADLIKELITSRERYLNHLNTKWQIAEEKNSCIMYVKDINGNLATKGETVIAGTTPDKVLEYVLDIEKRPEYDQMYNTGKIIKDYGLIGVVYQKFNGIFPVSARDFVIILCKQKIEGGYMLHGKSVPYDYPSEGKTVRAVAISAGFEIKEVSPGNVRVTYLTESDLCGSLPAMVKKTAGKMQSGVILKFREVYMKRLKSA